MQIPKSLRQASERFAQWAQAATTALGQWRRQKASDALEAERLDRIRNPSKYLGKP